MSDSHPGLSSYLFRSVEESSSENIFAFLHLYVQFIFGNLNICGDMLEVDEINDTS